MHQSSVVAGRMGLRVIEQLMVAPESARATRSHFSIDQHSTPHQLPEKYHGPQARSTV